MIRIGGRITGAGPVQAALTHFSSLLTQSAMGAMTEVLALASRTVRERFLRGPYPTEVRRFTGGFAATFARGHRENIWQVSASGPVITGTFGSTDIRAQVLEEGTGFLPGGVIKSSRAGGWLAIPTDLATTSPGGPRKGQYRNRSWRDVPNTYVGRTSRGGLYIAQRAPSRGRGSRGGIQVLAILVKEVRIAGRHYLEQTKQAVLPQIPAIFQARFDRLLTRLEDTLGRLRGP